MIVFGSSFSPYVRKVLAFAAEKGIALENRQTRLGDDDPEFRAASPLGKMPALADGDYRLADSSAIIHYLDAKFPEPELIPADHEARGKAIWFEEFADTILFACGRRMFFNRIVAPLFLQREGDLADADMAERDDLPPLLDYLEGAIPDSGWLVGEQLTLADIAVASPLANLRLLQVSLGDRPRLTAFAERMLARESFSALIGKEERLIAKLRGQPT